ncbi:MAG: hypothetical protein MUF84_11955 [Anaerolineae bacterium]|nr:hypothetical protein [Anaerolineae bacterium]
MQAFNRETQAGLDRITRSDLPEMEKLIQSFDWVTRRIIELAQREVELARAMSDEELAVKQSIKMNTLKLARGVFQDCYIRASGSRTRLWED